MGGEAAKERRRLKRLGKTGPTSGGEPGRGPDPDKKSGSPKQLKDDVQIRLQRKLRRKANGKFKAQSESPPAAPSPSSQKKQKPIFERQPFRQNKTVTNTQLFRAKENAAKKSKPKHLKRKIDLLSKSMETGNANVSDLDKQMKKMIGQMEQYKKMKQSNQTHAFKEGVHAGKDAKEDAVIADDVVKGDTESPPNRAENSHVSETAKSAGSSSPDNSDDEDVISDSINARSRGKRRRGRRDANHREEHTSKEKTSDKHDQYGKTDPSLAPGDDGGELLIITATKDIQKATEQKIEVPKKDDKRRCIGRKPVTDFMLGEKYPGRVRYIKPKLGVFIDIGCHSDAFCHISCVSDQFVSSVEDVLKVDDMIENARVVEIDRGKKRITVSLRSKEMAENEQERLKTTRQYEKGLHFSSGGSIVAANNPEAKRSQVGAMYSQVNAPSRSTYENNGSSPTEPSTKSKTGKDLKRERKLARRAERRAARETVDTS